MSEEYEHGRASWDYIKDNGNDLDAMTEGGTITLHGIEWTTHNVDCYYVELSRVINPDESEQS